MSLDSKKDLRFALWTVELLRDAQLTKKIADRCQSLKVSFYESGQSNDFEMTLENIDGFFSRPDVFRLGDEVRFYVWFADRPKQAMGRYSIDEIMNEAPPSIVRVNGLSTDTVGKELRTLRTEGYEDMSLHDIVFEIAERHELDAEVEGHDIRLGRKEQKEEHDLRFLNRLAEQYGYTCRITDGVLYFIERDVAEAKPITYRLTGLLSKRTFRYKTFETYQKAIVRYYDPETKEFRQHEVEDVTVKNKQKLKCTERVGSMEEAEKVAKARLGEANKCKIEGEFECLGVPELRAGINVIIEKEAAMFDGKWHIEEAHHSYSKTEGYKVRMKGYKIDGSVLSLPPLEEEQGNDETNDDEPPPLGTVNLITQISSTVKSPNNNEPFPMSISLKGDGRSFSVRAFVQSESGQTRPLVTYPDKNSILWEGTLQNGQTLNQTYHVSFSSTPIHAHYLLMAQANAGGAIVQTITSSNKIYVSR